MNEIGVTEVLTEWKALQRIACHRWDFVLSKACALHCLEDNKAEIAKRLKERSRALRSASILFPWDGDATMLEWMRRMALTFASKEEPYPRRPVSPTRVVFPLTDLGSVIYEINTYETSSNAGASDDPSWHNAIKTMEEVRAALYSNEIIG